jgi:hypothetical protein
LNLASSQLQPGSVVMGNDNMKNPGDMILVKKDENDNQVGPEWSFCLSL